MAETAPIVFVHHHTDRTDPENVKNYVPGAEVDVDVETARRLVGAHVAVYKNKTAAATADDAEGPTTRTARK
jgi:hypothetical protein